MAIQSAPPYEPADDPDTWYRHMVHGGLRPQADGTPHRQFLKSKAFQPPLQEWGRPWALEMSGRVLSRGSRDIMQKAEEGEIKSKVAARQRGNDTSGIRFRGLVSIDVRAARQFAEAGCDVMLEPNDDDSAHANFVVDRDIKSEIETMKKLAKLFRVIEPSEVEQFASS